jgi:hypothetical protein
MREKRTIRVQAHIIPSLFEQLELFRQEEGGNVISMSDYLHGVIEQHIAIRSSMRISKQRIGRRVGNQ